MLPMYCEGMANLVVVSDLVESSHQASIFGDRVGACPATSYYRQL